MKLTRRLSAIESFIPQNSILADIGCDHAYLACDAVQKGIVVKAYACDVKQGPLNAALSTINENNLQNKVIPVLSDGLQNVPEDANVCAIAGMGVETMKMILSHKKIKQFHTIILQPNSDADEMRKWAYEHDLNLTDESIVQEGHFYFILKYVNEPAAYLSEKEMKFGKYCTHLNDYKNYWNFRKERLGAIVSQMEQSAKKQELAELLDQINEQLASL